MHPYSMFTMQCEQGMGFPEYACICLPCRLPVSKIKNNDKNTNLKDKNTEANQTVQTTCKKRYEQHEGA